MYTFSEYLRRKDEGVVSGLKATVPAAQNAALAYRGMSGDYPDVQKAYKFFETGKNILLNVLKNSVAVQKTMGGVGRIERVTLIEKEIQKLKQNLTNIRMPNQLQKAIAIWGAAFMGLTTLFKGFQGADENERNLKIGVDYIKQALLGLFTKGDDQIKQQGLQMLDKFTQELQPYKIPQPQPKSQPPKQPTFLGHVAKDIRTINTDKGAFDPRYELHGKHHDIP